MTPSPSAAAVTRVGCIPILANHCIAIAYAYCYPVTYPVVFHPEFGDVPLELDFFDDLCSAVIEPAGPWAVLMLFSETTNLFNPGL